MDTHPANPDPGADADSFESHPAPFSEGDAKGLPGRMRLESRFCRALYGAVLAHLSDAWSCKEN